MKRFYKHLVKRGQVGQSIVILALGMIALLGFVGLTVDVSLLFIRYNNLRRAVDSAAIAAAGQVRQTGEGATSDVVTRASLAARQFIEFHGLNPRDVWVEMCENQPREDFDPATPGIQLEPPAITQAREAYDVQRSILAATISDPADPNYNDAALATVRRDVQVTRAAYISAMDSFVTNRSLERPPELSDLRTDYETALAGWNDANPNINWSPLHTAGTPYVNLLRSTTRLVGDDNIVCSPDVRKLVRVTAQVDSPTVFLRLLSPQWINITLQASAISETAVLDVVIVLDVSESMLFETNYEDWAGVNLGRAYVPPYLTVHDDNRDLRTITGRLLDVSQGRAIVPSIGITTQAGTPGSVIHPFIADAPSYQILPTDGGRRPSNAGTVWSEFEIMYPGGNPTQIGPLSASWRDWFWMEYIFGQWQIYINERLHFGGVPGSLPAMDDPREQFEQYGQPNFNDGPGPRPSAQYPVTSFIPSTVPNNRAEHPRPECRVRFYPYSIQLNLTQDWPRIERNGTSYNMADYYASELGSGVSNTTWPNFDNRTDPNLPQPRWGGFVPTYNFYGCCNDPTTGIFTSDGTATFTDVNTNNIIPNGDYVVPIVTSNPDGTTTTTFRALLPGEPINTNPDWDFSDLVCQPFKQAKDATRQFLRRIDFLRGDRVAFVTFDRSAFLIDTDVNDTGQAHMIESYDLAVDTLNRAIGVRAEPNFYQWDGERWTGFAAGIDPTTGESIPLDYGFRTLEPNADVDDSDPSALTPEEEAFLQSGSAAAVNYPVIYNCNIQNSLMQYPYSLYATRNVGNRQVTGINDVSGGTWQWGPPAMLDKINPDYNSAEWRNIINTNGLQNFNYESEDDWGLILQRSYERHGLCRGANIGAALREAGGALNDPRTSRREGSVWIIILLSDGAAGATDPIRRNGEKLRAIDPYYEIERFDFANRLGTPERMSGAEPPTSTLDIFDDNDTNRYGGPSQAEYGVYGLCPFGVTEFDGNSRIGNLVLGDPKIFPWCATPDPYARNFCLPTPGRAVGYSTTDLRAYASEAAGTAPTAARFPQSFGPGFQPNALDLDYRPFVASNQAAYDSELAAAEAGNRPPRFVAPVPDDYVFGESLWITDQNVRLGNIFDVDIGDYDDPDNLCDPLYDAFDYARDWADYIAGVNEDENSTAQLPIIFTIGFGLNFGSGNGSCEANIKDCMGEQLLRYIADAGDNFRIDNDVYQDMLHDSENWRDNLSVNPNLRYPTLNGSVPDEDWGAKDPCEPDFYGNGEATWRPAEGSNPNHLIVRTPGESCGNYFNAPTLTELGRVFDEIASRMFTRLSG